MYEYFKIKHSKITFLIHVTIIINLVILILKNEESYLATSDVICIQYKG